MLGEELNKLLLIIASDRKHLPYDNLLTIYGKIMLKKKYYHSGSEYVVV